MTRQYACANQCIKVAATMYKGFIANGNTNVLELYEV